MGPIGKTAVIAIGGGTAGWAASSLVRAATSTPFVPELAAAAADSGVAYAVTGDVQKALTIAAVDAAVGLAVGWLVGTDGTPRFSVGVSAAALVAGLAVKLGATYYIVK